MREKSFFKNKKVTVMGLGLHGGGLAAVNWLIKHGAVVTVTDLKNKKALERSIKKIKGKAFFVLGKHRKIDFLKTDLIVQNPGVPRESKFIALARKAGIPIENEASLFFKHCPGAIIGITGTRGKSTTSTLVYEMLKSKYPTTRLAGLPQVPMLSILDKIKANDLTVLELSSWQLEILGEQKISPQIAIITNIYPDHLNRYKGMKDYISAKAQIFLAQKSNDLVILNFDNPETKKLGLKVSAHRFWFSKNYFSEQNGVYAKNGKIFMRLSGKTEKLADIKDIKLSGQHNLENVLAALTVASIFSVSPKKIKQVLKNFSGLHSRLELIAEIGGVKYINDTTATTPDATMAALKAIKRNIILIAGGETKNIPDNKYQQLAREISKTCKAVILFKGRGSDQLFKFLKLKNLVTNADKMATVLGLAQNFAKKGDVILLSPACSSFNLFINEYDRGEQFNRIVRYL